VESALWRRLCYLGKICGGGEEGNSVATSFGFATVSHPSQQAVRGPRAFGRAEGVFTARPEAASFDCAQDRLRKPCPDDAW
jgi:hypothetical protein